MLYFPLGDSEENNLAKYETTELFLTKKIDLKTQAKPNYTVLLLLRMIPSLPKNLLSMIKLT